MNIKAKIKRSKSSVPFKIAYRYLKVARGTLLSRACTTDYHKVVFTCNAGRGYLCNPKYIAEALQRLYPGEFDLVLLVNEFDSSLPSYLRQVKHKSNDGLRELATARVWVDNFRKDGTMPKRSDQVYIQMWHGSLGPKRVEKDVIENLNPGDKWIAVRDSKATNLMVSNNDLFERLCHESFWYEGPVLRCGMPRSRPLVLGDEKLDEKIREAYGVAKDVAICLYAPTFRADWSMDQYRLDFDALASVLERRFNKPFVMAYRLHPCIANEPRPSFLRECIDMTAFEDTQELLAAVDVLISDYSSILEDFALTGRPGFIYAPDINDYLDDRGFYYPLEDRPFPIGQSEAQLLELITGFDEKVYQASVRDFLVRFGLKDDGRGDERLAEIIHALTQPGTSIGDILGK